MNTPTNVTLDAGLALLGEQQAWVQAARDGASWAEAGYFLRVDVRGELDPQRLQAALNNCLQCQPVLTTALRAVPGYHGLRQFAGEGVQSISMAVHTLEEPLLVVEQQVRQWCARPFQLEEGVFVQARLQRLEAGYWQLLLGIARCVADQHSLDMLLGELIVAYEQGPQPIDDDQAQFSQYLEWRSEVVQDEDAEAGKAYWQAQSTDGQAFAPGLPERQHLAIDPAHSQSLPAELDAQLVSGLEALAAEQGRTLDVLLQAAWWLLLARISGRQSFTGAWRHDARNDYEFFHCSMGVFEKTLPVSVSPDMSQPFSTWLSLVAGQLQEHITWQEYCPDVAPLALAYGFSVRTVFNPFNYSGLSWTATPVEAMAAPLEVVMNLLMDSHPRFKGLRLDYQPEHHSESAMQRLLGQYQVLLHSIVANPELASGQLSLLGEQERGALLALNPPRVEFSAQGLLPEIIRRWAEQTPDAPALVADGQSLSYAQLDQQVAQLAAGLAAEGVCKGAVVAIALPRSAAQVVAMLASWRAGAAYLPLDPGWPVARQQSIIQQAKVSLLLADAASVDLPAMSIAQVLERGRQRGPLGAVPGSPADAAYILFTSGSSGVPKGVVVEHQQLLNYTAGVSSQLCLEACRHFAFGSTVAADLGNTTLFGALYNGAALHIADDATLQDPQAFADFIQTQHIDCLKIVPSHLSALLDVPNPVLPAVVVLGGEAVSPALVERILQLRSDCRLFNHYGPTETTVGVLVHPVVLADAQLPGIALTQVLPNNEVYVLDPRQQLVAAGELGELYIGGQQLARGYLNQNDVVPQVFIDSPFAPGERLYRTGDLARYRTSGGIQLYGRRDQQVKVRGYRVELAEIEAQMLQFPEVSEAVLIIDQATAELAAFVVLAPGVAVEAVPGLKAALGQRLPAVMVPGRIERLERMPRLANGKVDRQGLHGVKPAGVQQAYVAPRDSLEQLIASRMAQLLGQERLSVDQDFFAAGGHSLLVIKLVAGVRKLLQCEIQPGLVFDHPTPAGLSLALRGLETTPGQLERTARARLQLDAMSPEEKAQMLEKARHGV
ncbi:amino acid adenylation protein [Paucimonas lemoignei]|jgi:amino acid adenylation domain-containing protein|nr:amino acid adenylation protein [Paucimonas lemoignei]